MRKMMLALVNCIKAAILLFCISLCVISQASSLVSTQGTCSRRPPSYTDCSTYFGDCNTLYDRHNRNTILLRPLPHPPPNTRTCYRTCFEDGVCKSFSTGVHEQQLQVVEPTDDFTIRRIYSPRDNNRMYRKSTNCRYAVKCNPGQLLSYSVHSFDLEEKGTCSHHQQCLDWVEIVYRNLETRRRFCGSGEVGEVHVDGSNEMRLEFTSNRRIQGSGFLYFVRCFDPGFDLNAVNSGVIPNLQQRSFTVTPCTQPLLKHRLPESPRIINVPRIFVVKMSWTILYKNDVIQIRDEQERVLRTIRGITRLDIANRFATVRRRYYSYPIGWIINGYGTLSISQGRGYFYQTGVDPIFQPSPAETKTILKLESAINAFLVDDMYDVEDSIDKAEELKLILSDRHFQHVKPRPTIQPRTLPWRNRGKRFISSINYAAAKKLASQYGNACNAVLRVTACTYQALIIGRDCKTGLALD